MIDSLRGRMAPPPPPAPKHDTRTLAGNAVPSLTARSTFESAAAEKRITTNVARGVPVVLSPAAPSGQGGLARSPEVAAAFIARFEERLGLDAATLKARAGVRTEDAHALFRATPHLFQADLQGAFAQQARLLDRPAPQTLILGDAHLLNFGTFRGPGGDPVFGPNDFDQAGLASPELDLERLATSAVLIARGQGLDEGAQRRVVQQIAERYLEEVSRLAAAPAASPPFLTRKEATGPVEDRITKAGEARRKDLLDDLVGKDGAHFKLGGELSQVPAEDRSRIERTLAEYDRSQGPTPDVARPLRVLDVVVKQGGGSSFGLPRYYALVEGAEDKKPRVLELKELLPIALDGGTAARGDALKVPGRQRELGALLNPLSGAVSLDSHSFNVREIEPEKSGLKDKDLNTEEKLLSVAAQTAGLLARAHARSPAKAQELMRWVGNDGAVLASRLEDFSQGYADQVEGDLRQLRAAPADTAHGTTDGAAFVRSALEDIRAQVAAGKTPRVVFDIDDTLADTRARTLAIAHAFDAANGTSHFASLTLDQVDFPAAAMTQKMGLPASVARSFDRFWQPRFFDPAAMKDDAPIASTIAIARAATEAGAEVVYLTGRPEEQRTATLAELERLGLPPPRSGQLSMFQPGDGADFKTERLARWKSEGQNLSLFLTESRSDIASAQRRVPGLPVVLFDSPLERDSAPPADGTPLLPFDSQERESRWEPWQHG